MNYMSPRTLIFCFTLVFFSSCVSYKELVTFDAASLPYGTTQAVNNALDLQVEPDDLLRINVYSVDPEAAAPFNIEPATANVMQVDPGALELFKGYIVDRGGFIDFPLLGPLKVEGMKLRELKDFISEKLKVYLKDPVVTARFLNFKITVLGEVNAPGLIRLTNSRVTVLDALGMAGDLTDYANRYEVVVIRETNKQRTFDKLNLQRADIFDSPFFYLKQNDVLYVQPIRAKTATVADPAQRLLPFATAVLSVITLLIALNRN
jgi:polysaccharide export outer membrane protein